LIGSAKEESLSKAVLVVKDFNENSPSNELVDAVVEEQGVFWVLDLFEKNPKSVLLQPLRQKVVPTEFELADETTKENARVVGWRSPERSQPLLGDDVDEETFASTVH
jgi:hypothetical protein